MDTRMLPKTTNDIAVPAGVIFAAAQISYSRRRRDAMLELVRSFQSPTFSKALRRVMELPDEASAYEIRKILGPEGEDLLVHLTATWETIGILLFTEHSASTWSMISLAPRSAFHAVN